MKYIPVVFSFDAAFAFFAAVSIYSVHKHTKTPVRYYCITPQRDAARLDIIEQLKKKYLLDLHIVPFDDEVFSTWKELPHISRSTYLRLSIPSLISENKIIYLDSDLIVLNDLKELYEQEIEQHILAGVIDPSGERTTQIQRVSGDRYINAGVLVLNLTKLKPNFATEIRELYEKWEEKILWQDQCLINKYAEGQKKIIDHVWNTQIYSSTVGQVEWLDKVKHAHIIHFTGETKPWMEWSKPEVSLFWNAYAHEMGLGRPPFLKMDSVERIVALAHDMDNAGEFLTASRVKSDIINVLMRRKSETAD